MTRRLALALLAGVGLALLLVGPGASAVTYPQAGYDGGRTGAVPFDLPRANDTAFELQLPGTPTGTVAVDDRTAHVVTLDHGIEVDNETLDSNALWSIDLDTAEVTKRFEIFDERPAWSTAFTDGERVYTQVEREVTAYDLDGEQLWTWQVPNRLPQAEHVMCVDDPAFRGGMMYLACLEVRERRAETSAGNEDAEEVPQTGLLVAALGTQTGEGFVWFQSPDRNPDGGINNGREEDVPAETWDVLNAEVTATDDRVLVYALTIGRPRLYSTTGPLGDGPRGVEEYQRQFKIWGFDASTGDYVLYREENPVRHERRDYSENSRDGNAYDEIVFDGRVTATSSSAFLQFDPSSPTSGSLGPSNLLWSFIPASGEERYRAELPSANDLKRDGSHAIAVRGDTLLAASPRSLMKFHASSGNDVWETTLPPSQPRTYGTSPLVLDGDRAVVETQWRSTDEHGQAVFNRSGYGLQAIALDTGKVLWDHPSYTDVGRPVDRSNLDPTFELESIQSIAPGFSSGLAVVPRLDGHVEVLGDTPLSMDGPDLDTERFPAAGENVTVDLSNTEPGAFGEATRYRVEWGDGAATPWREDPVFTHAYEEEGNVTARVFAGNDENQTTSTFVTMRVGQTEPNFIETAFKQENQDMTFGVLGVALALGGGLVGVGRRYRKRSNLQDELETLEEGFEETKHSPGECEAFLDERKARARSLALDGYLREDQVGVVENRAEELRARLRTGALEEEFGFLPHSLVVKAREMVQDGQVTRLEREAFLRALEEDEMLTRQQKTQVRERIEAWFARDAGGGGLPRGEEMDDA